MTEAYAVRGNIYIDPVTASAGGTLLRGVDTSRPIQLVLPHGLKIERFGGCADAVRSFRGVFVEPATLLVPAAGNTELLRKMLFSAHTTSSPATTSGGTALGLARPAREFRIVVRPVVATERYLFVPRLQLHGEAASLLNYSHVEHALLDESVALFVCARTESGKAAATWGTEAEVDAAML